MNKAVRGLIFILLILAVLRILLPQALTAGANWYLANRVPDYSGHLTDVDLAIIRGAYTLKGLTLRRASLPDELPPLVDLNTASMDFSWSDLINGVLIANVRINGLNIHFVDMKDPKKDQVGPTALERLKQIFDDFIPVQINRLVIQESSVYFKNPSANPNVDIEITHIDVRAKNLSTVQNEEMAKLVGTATFENSSKLEVNSRLEILGAKPQFFGHIELSEVQLPQLNDFFRAYTDIDFRSGELKLISEIKIQNSRVDGYAKAFLENIDMIGPNEASESSTSFFKQALLTSTLWLFKSDETGKSAFRIPISGRIDQPNSDIFTLLWSGLKNGFLDPLKAAYENQSIGSLIQEAEI